MRTGPGAARSGSGVAGRRRQGGIALLLYVVSALTIVGMAGMALDLGTAYLTRTRLQNAIDAAALDGARSLDLKLTAAEAIANATATFNGNFSASLLGTGVLLVQTSSKCHCDGVSTNTFTNETLNAKFVKVSVANVPVRTYLVNVFSGTNTIQVGGSAIAGPEAVGTPCNAIPAAVCATNLTDTDCSDGDCYGYSAGTEVTLAADKFAPGNWGFVQLCDANGNNCSNGGNDLRDGMAGVAPGSCFTVGGTASTKTGGNTGPVDQGINTRFNDYKGGGLSADTAAGDVITTPKTTSTSYSTYLNKLADPTQWDNPNGVAGRRTAIAPVIDCTVPVHGHSTVAILGSMCVFLTKESSGGALYVEMVPSCHSSGGSGTPVTGGNTTKIVLYQSSASS